MQFSRQFYIAQWYRDCSVETDQLNKKAKAPKTNVDADEIAEEKEKIESLLQHNEVTKEFLLSHIIAKSAAFASFK